MTLKEIAEDLLSHEAVYGQQVADVCRGFLSQWKEIEAQRRAIETAIQHLKEPPAFADLGQALPFMDLLASGLEEILEDATRE